MWENKEISLRSKIRLLNSKVLPVLLYGCETWDTTDADLGDLEVFLNKCRLRLAGARRLKEDGSILANAELHQMVRLPGVHLMIAKRRLPFITGVVGRGVCRLTRKMVFAEVPTFVGTVRWTRIPARMRRDYRKVCETDIENLGKPLDAVNELVREAMLGKKLDLRSPTVKVARKRLVGERERLVACTVRLCFFRCAELKELNRHLKTAHGVDPASTGVGPANTGVGSASAGVGSASTPLSPSLDEAEPGGRTGTAVETLYTGDGPPFRCGIGGCLMEYKRKGGHFIKHIANVHELTARSEGEQLWIRGLETRMMGDEPKLATGLGALDCPDRSGPLGGPSAAGVRADQGRTLVCGTGPGPESRDSGSDCIADGDSQTRYTDRAGKRLTSLGLLSGGTLQKWSETVVPNSCPFSRCPYPVNGKARSWKTWLNHCATDHGWNLSTGRPSRIRAGKAKAGSESASADSDLPNRKSKSLTFGAQTVVGSTVTTPSPSGHLTRQVETDSEVKSCESTQAELGVAPPRPRRGPARSCKPR